MISVKVTLRYTVHNVGRCSEAGIAVCRVPKYIQDHFAVALHVVRIHSWERVWRRKNPSREEYVVAGWLIFYVK